MPAYLAIILSLCLMGLSSPVQAKPKPGILGQPAPALNIKDWYQLPKDREHIELSDYRGKVVYLFFFQSWCPGCHSHGFPALKAIKEHFAQNPNVVFLTVQTVFEGFLINTSGKAKKTMLKHDLPNVPVGHDVGPMMSHSRVMQKFRSGGTPWTVIIDKKGIVQFNAFKSRAKHIIPLLNNLLMR